MLGSWNRPCINHTEAKSCSKAQENGIEKNNITREEFLSHAWEWKNQYGNIILDQLKKLDVHVIGIEQNLPWMIQ